MPLVHRRGFARVSAPGEHRAKSRRRPAQLLGEPVRCLHAALDDLFGEADLRGVSHSFLDACEGATVEKIGRVYGLAAASQLVCEGLEAFGLTLRVVEKQYFCQCPPLARATAYERDSTPIDRAPAIASAPVPATGREVVLRHEQA